MKRRYWFELFICKHSTTQIAEFEGRCLGITCSNLWMNFGNVSPFIFVIWAIYYLAIKRRKYNKATDFRQIIRCR